MSKKNKTAPAANASADTKAKQNRDKSPVAVPLFSSHLILLKN